MAFHRDPRVTSLAAIAGLLVAWDRQILQYRRYSWGSVTDFLISWFVHYIAVILILGVAFAITRGNASFLLGRSETLRKLTTEEGLIYGCIIVIVAAMAVFFIAHWVPIETDE